MKKAALIFLIFLLPIYVGIVCKIVFLLVANFWAAVTSAFLISGLPFFCGIIFYHLVEKLNKEFKKDKNESI